MLQPDDITNICLVFFRRKTAHFLLYLLLIKNLEVKLSAEVKYDFNLCRFCCVSSQRLFALTVLRAVVLTVAVQRPSVSTNKKQNKNKIDILIQSVSLSLSQHVVPLRSAGGRGSLVVLSQCRSFGVLLRLCERLVVLDDPLDHGATALLYPLQINHVGRHIRQLVRHADLTCGKGGRLRLPKTSAQYCY